MTVFASVSAAELGTRALFWRFSVGHFLTLCCSLFGGGKLEFSKKKKKKSGSKCVLERFQTVHAWRQRGLTVAVLLIFQ